MCNSGNNSDNSNRIDFYLEPLLIDTEKIKRIGIEKCINSIVVEIKNQVISQSIHVGSFSDHTIKPLKNQLSEVLAEFREEERKKLINSIITCINRNIGIISADCTESSRTPPTNNEESNKVDELINLVLESENTEKLFKDQYGKPFAAVRIGNERYLEILLMTNTKFKRFLTKLYRQNINSSISDGSLNTVITTLTAEAEFSNEVLPLHLRVAWGSDINRCRNDCIYYDLSDCQRNITEISKNGWIIISGSDSKVPILFRRYNQQPQMLPDRLYSLNIFDQFLKLTNVRNLSHQHLLKVYIVSLLIPEIDHVILTTYGPSGGAKSFLLELIKKLIDPTKPTLLTFHKNIEQFIQQVNHNYINYYDNVKSIPYWLSDEFCKAVTGAGHTKRQLYTDDEDIVYEHKRCLGLNGINISLTESDALDRSIFIELEEIDDNNRRKELDLWNEFDRIKPQILGYILDVLVKAMQIKQSLKLKNLPRMADFAEWGEAISQALGYPPFLFLARYQENRNTQNMIAVDENIVGSILVKYIEDAEQRLGSPIKIELTPQELRKEILDFAETNDIGIGDRQFPKNAASLVKKLKIILPNLKAAYGIIIKIGRDTATNTSVITIFRKNTDSDKNKDRPSTGGSEPSEEENTISKKLENIENIENSHIHNDTKKLDNQNNSIDEIRGGGDNDA